jgi:dTDP-4-amino-4,6-dideoxygalactose transaminase
LASRYLDNLASVRGVSWPQCLPGTNHARHLFTVWVDPEIRDFVVTALQQAGVQVMVNYRAIHLLTFFAETYGYAPGSFPVAEHIGASTISLPLFPSMSFEQVDIVSEALEDALASA